MDRASLYCRHVVPLWGDLYPQHARTILLVGWYERIHEVVDTTLPEMPSTQKSDRQTSVLAYSVPAVAVRPRHVGERRLFGPLPNTPRQNAYNFAVCRSIQPTS